MATLETRLLLPIPEIACFRNDRRDPGFFCTELAIACFAFGTARSMKLAWAAKRTNSLSRSTLAHQEQAVLHR